MDELGSKAVQPQKQPNMAAQLLFCFAGTYFLVAFPLLGAILTAFAVTKLYIIKRGSAAFIAIIAGSALVLAVSRSNAMALSAMGMGVIIVLVLRSTAAAPAKRQYALFACMVLMAAWLIAMDQWTASYAGTSIPEQLRETFSSQAVTLSSIVPGDAAREASLDATIDLVVSLWPFWYFARCGLYVFAAYLVARALLLRHVKGYAFRFLRQFDLGFAAVYLLGIGILVMAMSKYQGSSALWTAGLSTVYAVRLLFALQGFCLVRDFTYRRGFSAGGVIVLTVCAVLLESFTYLLSLLGLVDMWANFRKLDRGAGRWDGNETRK